MASKLAASRLLPPTPAPLQSPAVASARRKSTPRAHTGGNNSNSALVTPLGANDLSVSKKKSSASRSATPSKRRDSGKDSKSKRKSSTQDAKHVAVASSSLPPLTAEFPAIECLLQTLNDAVYSGVFQGGAVEHRVLELVSAATRELQCTAEHIAQLEVQNDALESACRHYKNSVSKIQTQSESLRRSSHGKDVLCDAQLQKLVVLLREVHGYEVNDDSDNDEEEDDEPAVSEHEQQQQQQQHDKKKPHITMRDDIASDNDDDVSNSSENEDEDEDDDDDDNSGNGSDDAHAGSSNQTEDDPTGDDDIDEQSESDAADSDSDDVAPLRHSVRPIPNRRASNSISNHALSPQGVALFLRLNGPVGKSQSQSNKTNRKVPPPLLSVVEPKKKPVIEPRQQRGSSHSHSHSHGSGTSRSSARRNSRLKFQFPETALSDDDLDKVNELNDQPLLRQSQFSKGRRFSSSATVVPLRRKSFSMKRSPVKKPNSIAVTTTTTATTAPPDAMDDDDDDDDDGDTTAAGPAHHPPAPAAHDKVPALRWVTTRRKSTSVVCQGRRSSVSASAAAAATTAATSAAAAAALATTGSTPLPPTGRRGSISSSQMVVRVRKGSIDGVPELVISKKPTRRHCNVVWHWHDRHHLHVPPAFETILLGPAQHGVMLRQLRYVKSVMHDLPWAKTQLKELLAAYTHKDVTKEQLYPQLNHLSDHVQRELGGRAVRQRQLAQRKHRLTLQLTLAAGALNDFRMLKFGRRGKPHETQLRYDPSDPTRLHWLRKTGDRSDEFLRVDELDVHVHADSLNHQRAARKYPLDASACVSLVTPVRSLDVQLQSSLQRDWLLNALRDVIAFAKQYTAAGAVSRRQQMQQLQHTRQHHHGSSSRR